MKYSYRNDNGKVVHGAAALMHLIYTVCGGPVKFIIRYAPVVTKPVKKAPKKFFSLFRKAA